MPIIWIIALTGFLWAETTNAIAIKVQDEIITTQDIQDLVVAQKVTAQKARDILIDEALALYAIGHEGIVVGEQQLIAKIKEIAIANRINSRTLRMQVTRNMSWATYKQTVKKQLEQEYLYAKITAQHMQEVTPEMLYAFYESNPQIFTTYGSITVRQYKGSNEDLSALVRTQKPRPTLQIKSLTLDRKNTNPTTYDFLTQQEAPRQIIGALDQQGLAVYERIDARDAKLIAYEQVQNAIANVYAKSKRLDIFKAYLQALKAKTPIIYLR